MRRLRSILFALLLAGMAFVGFRFPSQPGAGWPEARGFGLGSEACRELLEGREQTTFTWPEAEEKPVSLAEVARRFDLELALVCEANGRPPACGGSTLAPGEQIVLPLGPEPSGIAPARAGAAGDSEVDTGPADPAAGAQPTGEGAR